MALRPARPRLAGRWLEPRGDPRPRGMAAGPTGFARAGSQNPAYRPSPIAFDVRVGFVTVPLINPHRRDRMCLVPPADSWHKKGMTVLQKIGKPHTAPALFRLLEDSALSRAALGCCGIPLAMLDANAKSRPLTYVNSAFEAFFGYREGEALGRSLAAVLLRNDEPLLQRLLAESPKRCEATAWGKDGKPRQVEIALAGLRDTQ